MCRTFEWKHRQTMKTFLKKIWPKVSKVNLQKIRQLSTMSTLRLGQRIQYFPLHMKNHNIENAYTITQKNA